MCAWRTEYVIPVLTVGCRLSLARAQLMARFPSLRIREWKWHTTQPHNANNQLLIAVNRHKSVTIAVICLPIPIVRNSQFNSNFDVVANSFPFNAKNWYNSVYAIRVYFAYVHIHMLKSNYMGYIVDEYAQSVIECLLPTYACRR